MVCSCIQGQGIPAVPIINIIVRDTHLLSDTFLIVVDLTPLLDIVYLNQDQTARLDLVIVSKVVFTFSLVRDCVTLHTIIIVSKS